MIKYEGNGVFLEYLNELIKTMEKDENTQYIANMKECKENNVIESFEITITKQPSLFTQYQREDFILNEDGEKIIIR